MAKDDVLIEIVDRANDTTPPADSVDYAPFGVKVLKLRVRRNPATQATLGPIWVHPQNFRRPDEDATDPVRWRVYGTADDDPDLWVAWGAGDENGFCAKTRDPWGFSKEPADLDDDCSYFVYLHLIHRPADPLTHVPADKQLTVVATSAGSDTEIFGELAVTLTVPQGLTDPVRASWATLPGKDASVIRLTGGQGQPATQLPAYVSRWWPSRRIAYQSVDPTVATFLAELEIVYERGVAGTSDGRLTARRDGQILAEYSGDLEPPLYDQQLCTVELLRFTDDRHLVLRVWFYWLHLKFPPAAAPVTWQKEPEAPDVERFDLVLDLANPHYRYVGTDIHWQEYWGKVTEGKPLQARLATASNIPKLIAQGKTVAKFTPLRPAFKQRLAKRIQSLANNLIPGSDPDPCEHSPVVDPLADGLCDLVNEYRATDQVFTCPNRPNDNKVVSPMALQPGDTFSVCQRCGTHFHGPPERKKGVFWAKHAPFMENVKVIEGAVSTNVLHG